jgi:segregation and condensation protein B
MEAAVEAVLFVSSEPVPRSRLAEIFDEDEREAAAEAIEAVLARYAAAEERGVQIEEVAGGVRLITRPEMNGWLRRFFEVTGSTKLSMAALETLAIIAYRQPMTGPEIQDLRSVNPSGVLKTLLDRHLIRIAGRKEVVGRPFLYCTTREFLVHFGLKTLKDLPPLEEFEEAFEESADVEAPPDPGLGAGPGGDREETVLRTAAEIEERGSEAEALAEAEDAPPPTSPEPVEGRGPEQDEEPEPIPAGHESER